MSSDVTTESGPPTVTHTNPYWEAVRDWVCMDGLYHRPMVGGFPSGGHPDRHGPVRESSWVRAAESRFTYVARWSWTVTAPWTVDFVADHVGPRVLDPMAGTGWWAALLRERGIDVAASDLNPPDGGEGNHWHKGAEAHTGVERADALDAVRAADPARTLLLSWPIYNDPLGEQILDAYRDAGGRRVVYMGEGPGGCCGDDGLFQALHVDWIEVADHGPVQWMGIHDQVLVFDRP